MSLPPPLVVPLNDSRRVMPPLSSPSKGGVIGTPSSSSAAANAAAASSDDVDYIGAMYGFSVAQFMESIFHAVDEHIADGMDAMEVALMPSYTDDASRQSLKEMNDAFVEFMIKTYELNLDKFEIYCTRNIFAIPPEVEALLSSDPSISSASSSFPGSARKKPRTNASRRSSAGGVAATNNPGTPSTSTSAPHPGTPLSSSSDLPPGRLLGSPLPPPHLRLPATLSAVPTNTDQAALEQRLASLRLRLLHETSRRAALSQQASELSANLSTLSVQSAEVDRAVEGATRERTAGLAVGEAVRCVVGAKEGMQDMKEEGGKWAREIAKGGLGGVADGKGGEGGGGGVGGDEAPASGGRGRRGGNDVGGGRGGGLGGGGGVGDASSPSKARGGGKEAGKKAGSAREVAGVAALWKK